METVVLAQCDSTNRRAFLLAEQGAEHGTSVLADTQTAGRGRLGRVWQSPPGRGLYCSVIIRAELASIDYPCLTFAAGLATAAAIERCCNVRPGLKWPNDIYFRARKCGGILNESSQLTGPQELRFAVIGIGLNLNTRREEFPPELRGKATSLLIETGGEVSRDSCFAELHQRLLEEVRKLEREGVQQAIERWRCYDFMKGTRMAWVTLQGKRVDGVSLGPDDRGLLHVRDDNGLIHEVCSGDIELL